MSLVSGRYFRLHVVSGQKPEQLAMFGVCHIVPLDHHITTRSLNAPARSRTLSGFAVPRSLSMNEQQKKKRARRRAEKSREIFVQQRVRIKNCLTISHAAGVDILKTISARYPHQMEFAPDVKYDAIITRTIYIYIYGK